jgi:PAS domain S-box-containing protein
MISVLYVDDEPGLLELCRIFLEQTGDYRVDTVASAEEALAQLEKKQFDAIISDFLMPAMDGISLLKSIRQRDSDIPFILFTGRGREEVVIDALNNGADFYLQKGGDIKVQFVELMHKVRQAVNKRQAERDLHESEKLLTDIINFLPDATFAIDREGKVIAWNRAIEELTGIPAAGMLGKGDHEYAIPFYGRRRPILIDLIFEPEEQIQEHYSGIRRENEILIAETDLPRPRGMQLTLMGKASPLYDRQGKISGAIESIRDITARKQIELDLRAAYEKISATEEKLREQYDKLSRHEQILRDSEEKYRTLADTAQDLIYIINKDDTVAYINTFAATMMGMSSQEIIGKPRSALFPGPDGERQYRNLQQVFTYGMSLHVENEVHLPSRDTWQDTNLIPLKNPKGTITAVMGISRDITPLKQTENALRRSESQYRSIIENMQDMLYRTDMEGKITMISPAGAKLAGYDSAEEMIGLDLAQTLCTDSQEWKKFLAILAREGSVNAYPLFLRDRNGHPHDVTASSHYFYDAQGNVLGIEGIIHDVTHLIQMVQALKEANRRLNLLNSITRHDVANQLTVLQGYTQLAMIKNADPVISDFLQKITTVTATIGRQIEFSKTYQELGIHAPGWFSLDDIFAKIKPKDILFSNSCTGAEVFADPMLEKVFANLFANSLMHGERVSRVTVRCEPAGNDLLITVEDNGVGIPLDLKEDIFRKGFGKNTGFGLFLAREILAITGISIHETGKHGSGARFEVIVPKNGFRYSGDRGSRNT